MRLDGVPGGGVDEVIMADTRKKNTNRRGVVAQLRELASRESEVVAFLVNNKSSKLPLTQKSRSWNIAFQQGIYEGVRRCEDLLRERPGPRNATTRDFMKSPERQAWNCERCGSEGAVEIKRDSGCYEVLMAIQSAHAAKAPTCADHSKIRVPLTLKLGALVQATKDFDMEAWKEQDSSCLLCHNAMGLDDGCEWPDDPRLLLCWGCMSNVLAEMFATMEAPNTQRSSVD